MEELTGMQVPLCLEEIMKRNIRDDRWRSFLPTSIGQTGMLVHFTIVADETIWAFATVSERQTVVRKTSRCIQTRLRHDTSVRGDIAEHTDVRPVATEYVTHIRGCAYCRR